MPFYEYRCTEHRDRPDSPASSFEFTVFFKTFSEAEEYADQALCDCGETATRIPSSPLGFGLYGDPTGYSKPSATKRFNTKTVSKYQGNRSAVG